MDFIRGRSAKISVATITFFAARKTVFRRRVKRSPSDNGLSQKSSLSTFLIDLASIASIRLSLSKFPKRIRFFISVSAQQKNLFSQFA